MKINHLHVDGFGVWKGLDVENLSSEVTVFHGYNEAGKTTLMQFVRSMMFGFDPKRLEKYTPPVYGGLAGGAMDISTPNGTWEVIRHVDPNRHMDPVGDLTVTDHHDGSVHGNAQLVSLMTDVDESIFNNVFAIGLREIQELNALNSTAASDYLYRLTSGVDRVSLIDVMRDLHNRREAIWSADPKASSRLQVLTDRRQKLLREVDQLKQNSKRWSRIASETTDVDNQLADLQSQIKVTERESRKIEIATQIAERWQSRIVVRDQIAAYKSLPSERDVNLTTLDSINEKIALQKERVEQTRSQRKSIKTEAMALPINRELWSQKARIEAISEHTPWVQSLERQNSNITEEISKIENTLVGEVDGLGHQLKIRARDISKLRSHDFQQLEDQGKKLVDAREHLEEVKQELEKAEFDLGQHNQRLNKSATELGTSDTLEETSTYVNRLKRRVELEKKIEKLNRNRGELERDIDTVVSDQVLPVEKLSIIGVVFVVGFVLLFLGVLSAVFKNQFFSNLTETTGLMFLLMGLIGLIVSLVIKHHWERVAKDELDDYRHQIDIVRQQLKRAKLERDEIERELPAGSMLQHDLALEEAQAKLHRLTDLVPLQNRVETTKMGLDELRRQISVRQRGVDQANSLWQQTLVAAGLPEALQPHQLREIINRSDRISGFQNRLEQLKSERDQKQKEISTIRQRIDATIHETGLASKSSSLSDRLAIASRAINEQRIHVTARKELASRYKSLRTRLNKAKRELDRQLGIKQRMLSVVGADSEEAFREIAAKHNRRRKLARKEAELNDQIQLATGKHFTYQDMAQVFTSYGSGGLEKHWENLQSELELAREEQNRLMQHRGELLQEVKSLGDDSRLDVVRLELNSIESEIAHLKAKWQELGTSSQMLEMIRESYESRRQPETLKEASNYLSKLSEGRYVRIWTRMTGEELLVDNAADETLPVENLSRGTREAVFLSLRLALVGAYARRGATVPMVLDDVLVNFDGKRARAAAEVLFEFSRNGYQLLMFTCHDHIRDIFHSLGADVRILPAHKDVFDSSAKPVQYGGDGTVAAPPVIVQEKPTLPEPVIERQTFEPQPAAHRIPVEYVAPTSTIDLAAGSFDDALKFELSAVETDQRREHQLRSEMVYVPSNKPTHEILLSGNDPVWFENSVVMR